MLFWALSPFMAACKAIGGWFRNPVGWKALILYGFTEVTLEYATLFRCEERWPRRCLDEYRALGLVHRYRCRPIRSILTLGKVCVYHVSCDALSNAFYSISIVAF
jgi:hypothetical protein